MKTKTLTSFVILLIICNLSIAQSSYVQITNCDNNVSAFDFAVGGNSYKPLVCNYLIEFIEYPSGQWYISPTRQSTSNGYTPSPNQWQWDFGSGNFTNSKTIALAKINADLQRIKNLGFTEIRLVGVGLINQNSATNPSYNYPTNNQTIYFNLLDAFMTQAAAKNLRVILLLGGGAEYYQDQNSTYKNFISSVASHYVNNTTLMAYDLFNEPDNRLWAKDKNDKYIFSKMINDWNNCVKKNDPNHLTTIGLLSPLNVYSYDPMLMSIDFVSYHPYPSKASFSDFNKLLSEMDTYFYWCGKSLKMPWIIGETSYGATNSPYISYDANNNPYFDPPNLDESSDPEANQVNYLKHTYERATDCNCKGYSWWKYQDSKWGPQFDNEDYMGLYYRYAGTSEGSPKKIANPLTSPFIIYSTYNQVASNCIKPANYHTILAGTSFAISGYVKDENNIAIKNAIVIGKINGVQYKTFTDLNGFFNVFANGSPLHELYISYPEHSNYYGSNPSTGVTYTLKKTYNNSWAKEWENSNNKLSNNWIFSSYDKFHKGDFDGDGRQDLLCIKYSNSTSTTDRMAIYTFNESFSQFPMGNDHVYNLNSDWKLIWDKPTSNLTESIYPFRHNLVVGDFNGDNKDDIISLNGIGAWSTWFSFTPNTNPINAGWQWMDSNYGTVNDPAHPMSYMTAYNSNVVSGDFYGNGRDGIIGVSGNYITSFLMINNTWTWIQSNSGLVDNNIPGNELSYLTNYKNQLLSGDFDGDGKDEIFGNNNGTLAIFKASWSTVNPVWKWVNSSDAPYWLDLSSSGNSGMQPYVGNLVVGNVDTDKNDEIIGFSSSFCANFNFSKTSSAQTFSFAWDGPAVNKISDWNIAPSAFKYLMLKTDINAVNGQQKLLAIRNNVNSWSANLLAFRPNIRHYWPCSTVRLAANSTPTITSDEKENNLQLYPNPSQGEFTVLLEETFNQNTLQVNFYDIQGREVSNYNLINEGSDKILKIKFDNVMSGIYYLKIRTANKSYTQKVVIL